MFPHKTPEHSLKKGLSSPKKAFTNNEPEPAIRDDEELRFCSRKKKKSFKMHHRLRGNIWPREIRRDSV